MMERFALANPGVTLLVVDVKEPADVVEALVDSTGITMPVGLDLDGQAQLAWNAYALPVHFFVDATASCASTSTAARDPTSSWPA